MTSLSFHFGTVGSPISTGKKPGGSEGATIQTAQLGLSALELGWVRSVRVSEKTCAKIKSAGETHNVALSVHAPYFINLNGDEEEWPKSRKRLMDAARAGYLAGATDIVFHPGSYFENPPEEVLKAIVPRLRGCVEELLEEDNTVILRPETMGKSSMIGSLEDTIEMSKEIEGVEPCIDFAHLHARPGDGSMNTYDEWCRTLEQYAEVLGDESLQRLHAHLSGIDYTEKGEKEHLPLKESDFDLNALLRALNEFKCKGRILIESPVMEGDALYTKNRWIEISGENE